MKTYFVTYTYPERGTGLEREDTLPVRASNPSKARAEGKKKAAFFRGVKIDVIKIAHLREA